VFQVLTLKNYEIIKLLAKLVLLVVPVKCTLKDKFRRILTELLP